MQSGEPARVATRLSGHHHTVPVLPLPQRGGADVRADECRGAHRPGADALPPLAQPDLHPCRGGKLLAAVWPAVHITICCYCHWIRRYRSKYMEVGGKKQ